jgi:hypothetical protein
MATDVSEARAASIIALWNVGRQLFYTAVHPRRQIWVRLTHRPDDGGSTYLWNVGRHLFYTAVHPRRQIRVRLTHSPDDGGSTYLWNVGRHLFYTAVHPRRQIWVRLIALMMEAARTSETSVDNYFTRKYIPKAKFELHTRRREISKSHILPGYLSQHSRKQSSCSSTWEPEISPELRKLKYSTNVLKYSCELAD